MRLRIELEMDGSVVLPFSYRRGIHAFIYSSLDNQESEILHNMDNGEIKPFVFSDIMGKYTLEENGLRFLGSCVLYLASPYYDLLNDFYNFCIENKFISLFGNYIPISKINQFFYKEKSGTIPYRCISPITIYETIEDNKTIFYSPEDSLFKKKVKENIIHKYEIIYQKQMDEYLNIYKFENIKKQIVEFKGFRYEAYYVNFIVDCKQEIPTLIMDMGVGYRNPIGLGMLEYAD